MTHKYMCRKLQIWWWWWWWYVFYLTTLSIAKIIYLRWQINEWVRSISVMIVTGNSRNTASKSCPTATLYTDWALVYIKTEHRTIAGITEGFNTQVSLKDSSRTNNHHKHYTNTICYLHWYSIFIYSPSTVLIICGTQTMQENHSVFY